MIDNGAVQSRVRAFEKEQGDGRISDGTFYLWPNGAMRDTNPLGVLAQPPTDPLALNENKVHYWKTRLKQAIAMFDQRKSFYLAESSNIEVPLSCSEEEVVAELKKLQKEVQHCRAEHERAVKGLKAVLPAGFKNREALREKARKHNEPILRAVQSIEI